MKQGAGRTADISKPPFIKPNEKLRLKHIGAIKMDDLNDNIHEEISDILENLSVIYSSCTSIKEVERIENYSKELDKIDKDDYKVNKIDMRYNKYVDDAKIKLHINMHF